MDFYLRIIILKVLLYSTLKVSHCSSAENALTANKAEKNMTKIFIMSCDLEKNVLQFHTIENEISSIIVYSVFSDIYEFFDLNNFFFNSNTSFVLIVEAISVFYPFVSFAFNLPGTFLMWPDMPRSVHIPYCLNS